MTKRTLRSKKTRTKALPYARTAKTPKKAKKAPAAPETDRFRSIIHDAIEALDSARRAHDDMSVYRFRGKEDHAAFEHMVYLESLQRVHAHLVTLDLDLPEVMS